eukprot:scaffold2606_cov57-Cyclotella_meneghiniana.AAC.3
MAKITMPTVPAYDSQARNEAPARLSTATVIDDYHSKQPCPQPVMSQTTKPHNTHHTNNIQRETETVHQQGDFNVKTDILDNKRRSYLQSTGACLAVLGGPFHSSHFAYANDSTAMMQPDFGCLLDLPPVTPDCARIYLCRHGQTENNRLHLVQGARVDPPINANGREQAKRLGMAISRLMASDGGVAIPNGVVHSTMRRARETAETLTCVANESPKSTTLKLMGELPTLTEVDFGSLEGTDSNNAKRQMTSTFAAWSIGDIDKILSGGESGRDVLMRAAQALEQLSAAAVTTRTSNNSSSSILAVSHSVYLRVLLSMVNDSSLAQSAFMKINNGSVSVVDVNVKGKSRVVNLNSGLFGGGRLGLLSGRKTELNVVMPEAYLIRQNEIRHLNGMGVVK